MLITEKTRKNEFANIASKRIHWSKQEKISTTRYFLAFKYVLINEQ
jgi:hypothetical protein